MVDHQKTLYEVMKWGVDSDQKLNHVYATGLLKKNSEFFATIIIYFFTMSNKKFLMAIKILRDFHIAQKILQSVLKKTVNFDFYKYFIFVAFELNLDFCF